ncbi:MAG: crossover junction endodeoxyribonuclease RuvC, partial [Cyclobacteriaceae bacterium]
MIDKSAKTERIILGLDPGTNVMGYGLIVIKKPAVHLLQYGVIHLSKYVGHELKLKKIFDRVSNLIEEYAPD